MFPEDDHQQINSEDIEAHITSKDDVAEYFLRVKQE
jgi:hypothetical protein